MQGTQHNHKSSKAAAAIVIVLMAVVTVVALVWFLPYAADFMRHAETRQRFADWVASKGIWAPVVIILMQVVQIVIAFLPGEPVEILAGMVCGGVGGLMVCLVGIFIGSAIVFFAVRSFGKAVVHVFFTEEQLYKYRFMNDTKRLERILFIVFFIPGTPKDILNYIAGLTKINPVRFLLISTLARIPSVITSTMAGDAIVAGNYGLMAAFFVLAAILALMGLRIHSAIGHRLNCEADSERAVIHVDSLEALLEVNEVMDTEPSHRADGMP